MRSKWSYLFWLVGITRTRLAYFLSCTRSTCYRRRWISAFCFTICCLASWCLKSYPFLSKNLVIVLDRESELCYSFRIVLTWEIALVLDRFMLGSIVWSTTATCLKIFVLMNSLHKLVAMLFCLLILVMLFLNCWHHWGILCCILVFLIKASYR